MMTSTISVQVRPKLAFLVVFLLAFAWLPCPSLAKTFHQPRASYKAPKEDPYRVLGLQHGAKIEAVKKAYRKTALEKHPDKNPDMDPSTASDNFRRIVEAWEFLSDPGSKRTYDLMKKQRGNQQRQGMMTTQHQRQQRTTHTNSNGRSYTSTTYGSHQNKQQNAKQNTQQQQKQKHYQQNYNHADLLRDARAAQEHVLKVSSLEQLLKQPVSSSMPSYLDLFSGNFFTKLVDHKTQRWNKHFLCVFVANKRIERYVDDELLFPLSFAGPKPGRHGILWDSILKTAKVRYNGPNALTEAFKVPHTRKNDHNNPYIIFGKQGDHVSKFRTYRPKATAKWTTNGKEQARDHLEDWVMEALTSIVVVANYHHSDVRIFRKSHKHDQLREIGAPLPPGHQTTLKLSISDRIIIVDARTDQFFHGMTFTAASLNQDSIMESVALAVEIITKLEQTVEVGAGYGATRQCYDRSLQCHAWSKEHKQKSLKKGSNAPNCVKYPEFHSVCPYSCDVCLDTTIPGVNSIYYALFHTPLHSIPTPFLRAAVEGVRDLKSFASVVLEDFLHMLAMRRNVAFGFWFLGFQLGCQLVLLAHMMITTTAPHGSRGGGNNSHSSCYTTPLQDNNQLGVLIFFNFCVIGWGYWVVETSPSELPDFLRGFQKDLVQMIKQSMDLIYALFFIGFFGLFLSKQLLGRMFPKPEQSTGFSLWVLSKLALLVVVSLMLGMADFVMQHDLFVDGKQFHRFIRWSGIWQYCKNVAATILILGSFAGSNVLRLGHFFKQGGSYLLKVSVCNVAVAALVLFLSSQDRVFQKDLGHVLSFRMSAAIPLAIVGLFTGMSLVHILSTYQVKVKLD